MELSEQSGNTGCCLARTKGSSIQEAREEETLKRAPLWVTHCLIDWKSGIYVHNHCCICHYLLRNLYAFTLSSSEKYKRKANNTREDK